MFARTAALFPVLDEDVAAVLELGSPLPLKDAGPGYTALGSWGYADDTQVVALGATSLQGTVSATGEWLQVRGQDFTWTNGALRSRGNRAPRRSYSGVSGSRWRRLFANLASTSPWGVPKLRGWCYPSAWKRDGAPSAASPISPPTTAKSRP